MENHDEIIVETDAEKTPAPLTHMPAPSPDAITPEIMDSSNPATYQASDIDVEDNLHDVVKPSAPRMEKNFDGEKGLMDLCVEIPALYEAMLELKRDHPDWLDMDEHTLKEKFKDKINLTVLRLRMSLWQEYESSRYNSRKMYFTKVYAGICSEQTARKIIREPSKLAFIICPPPDYLVVLKEAHTAGLNALRDILAARVVDEEGYLLPRAADVVIKAFALLDLRLKGAVVQKMDTRILSKSENVNLTVRSEIPSGHLGGPMNMDEIDRELEKARKTLSQIHSPKPISTREIEYAREKILDIPTIHSRETEHTPLVDPSKTYVNK